MLSVSTPFRYIFFCLQYLHCLLFYAGFDILDESRCVFINNNGILVVVHKSRISCAVNQKSAMRNETVSVLTANERKESVFCK